MHCRNRHDTQADCVTSSVCQPHTHTHLVRIRSLPGPKSGWRTLITPIGGRPGLAEWCFFCTCALGVMVAVIALSLLKPPIFASKAYGGLANKRAWVSGNTSDYQPHNSRTPQKQGETKHRQVPHIGSARRLWQAWIWLLCLIMSIHVTAATPEATTPSGGNPNNTFSWIRKRAFRRARARALLHGGTWYKGKWHTPSTLGAEENPAPRSPGQSTHHPQRASHQGRRLHVLSLNVGMLSTSAYEFLAWANHPPHPWDIICLQETGWTLEQQFQAGNWHIVCSGHARDRNSGVMTLISRTLLPADRIRYSATHEGRLLWVKLEFKSHHVDILNVYQHVWNTTAPVPKLLHQRDKIWTKLNQTICHLAVRSTLLILGDFNTPLMTAENRVGKGL